jgi:cytochrome c oxidase subunit II
MNVDLYERIWMISVGVMLAVMFSVMAVGAIGHSEMPPSHVETIDPRTVLADARFRQAGVSVDQGGHLHATIVGTTFAWLPGSMTIPAGTPVTFHVTSIDVIHGFEIVRTNGQTMVIPGYVSQFTTQFAEGEYMVACNEYCGVGHHLMFGKLTVVPQSQWHAPTTVYPGATVVAAAGDSHERQ